MVLRAFLNYDDQTMLMMQSTRL